VCAVLSLDVLLEFRAFAAFSQIKHILHGRIRRSLLLVPLECYLIVHCAHTSTGRSACCPTIYREATLFIGIASLCLSLSLAPMRYRYRESRNRCDTRLRASGYALAPPTIDPTIVRCFLHGAKRYRKRRGEINRASDTKSRLSLDQSGIPECHLPKNRREKSAVPNRGDVSSPRQKTRERGRGEGERSRENRGRVDRKGGQREGERRGRGAVRIGPLQV